MSNPILTNAGVAGGTSFSSPSFAGIMAIVDQKAGGRQGLANYILYQLAAAENFSSCNSSNRTNPAVGSSSVFNDITVGNNNVPGQTGFNAAQGFDMATGLGSVDANNLVNAWPSSLQASQTTLTSSTGASINVTHGQSVTLTATVQKAGGGAGPTGTVAIVTDSGLPPGVGARTLASGSFSAPFGNLPGGTYNLSAHYPGDGTFGPSDSTGIPTTEAPENSAVTIHASIVNLATGTVTAGSSAPYGDTNLILVLDAVVTGLSGQGTPTGNLVWSDGGAIFFGAIILNSFAQEKYVNCLENQGCFLIGTHSITASYSGDSSFNKSNNNSSPLTITITKGNPTVAILPLPNVASGQTFNATAQIKTGFGSVSPTGTVQFFDGTTSLGAPVTVNGVFATEQVSLAGQGSHTITARYSGDNTYNPAFGVGTISVGPAFNFSAMTTAQTIAAGGTATYNLTLNNPGGFTGAVNFTCTGAPGGATCAVSPNPANLTSLVASVPLTVTVSNTANARLMPGPFKSLPFVFAGVLAILFAGRRRKQLMFLLLATFLIAGVISCGGGGGAGGGGNLPRPPTNATLTVTATGGSFNVQEIQKPIFFP